MQILRSITAIFVSVVLVGTQLACYAAGFDTALRLAGHLGYVEDIQDVGFEWALFAHGVVFHLTIAFLLFFTLVPRSPRHSQRTIASCVSYRFMLLLMRAGLPSISIFFLGMGIIALVFLTTTYGMAVPLLLFWFVYVLAWIPFILMVFQERKALLNSRNSRLDS